MKFGLFTLGDFAPDPMTGVKRTQAQRLADILTLAEWAEELGFASFHIGEHHFCDYIVSNPVPLLAACAMRTKRIKLSTAVTLLANRDPSSTRPRFHHNWLQEFHCLRGWTSPRNSIPLYVRPSPTR